MNYICNCKKYYFFDRSYVYWEDRAVTSDEMDIINFLDNKKKIQLRSVLHVGIGNSYFAKNLLQDLILQELQSLKKKLKQLRLCNC
jgi:hypothetical protein